MWLFWLVFAGFGVCYFLITLDSKMDSNNPVAILAPLIWSGYCIYRALKLKNKENGAPKEDAETKASSANGGKHQ